MRVSILDADVRVKPEMTASVTFQEGDGPGTEPGRTRDGPGTGPAIVLVTRRAVSDQNGQSIVWVVAGGKATRRTVTPGLDRLDQIEVTSGLAPGETVIVNPPAGLTDGARVRVKGSSNP